MRMPLTEHILKNEFLERLWIAWIFQIMQSIQLGMCICLIYLIVIWEVVFGDVKAKRLFNLVWNLVNWNLATQYTIYICICNWACNVRTKTETPFSLQGCTIMMTAWWLLDDCLIMTTCNLFAKNGEDKITENKCNP